MLTLGFSILPCACAARGTARQTAAMTANESVRSIFIGTSDDCGVAHVLTRAGDTIAMNWERRCSHRAKALSTRRRVREPALLLRRQIRRRAMQVGGPPRLDDLAR